MTNKMIYKILNIRLEISYFCLSSASLFFVEYAPYIDYFIKALINVFLVGFSTFIVHVLKVRYDNKYKEK